MSTIVNTNFLTSLLAVTSENYSPTLEDNVFNKNATLMTIKDNSMVQIDDGGQLLNLPLMVDGSASTGSYTYFDDLDITPQSGLINAQTSKANYYSSIVLSGQEINENSGKSQIINIMTAKLMQAEKSLRSRINTDLYLDGSGNSNKNIKGLLAMIPTSTSPGTYLSINGATETNWTQQYATGTNATLLADLTKLFYSLSDGDDRPDLILTSATGMTKYENANRATGTGIQYKDAKLADAGFITVDFKGSPMVLDQAHPDNTAGSLPIYHMLTSEYLGFYWNMSGTSEFVKPANQNAKVAQMFVECQLVTNNRRRQGKLNVTS